MKAAFIQTFGSPDVINIGEMTVHDPQPDEVVVRIEAADINPLDIKIVAGYL